MSILVKGMEMPKNCHECPFLYVTVVCDGSKPCPILDIKPHGDLIDRDEAYNRFLELMKIQGGINPCQLGTILVDAPTIIESEGEDD